MVRKSFYFLLNLNVIFDQLITFIKTFIERRKIKYIANVVFIFEVKNTILFSKKLIWDIIYYIYALFFSSILNISFKKKKNRGTDRVKIRRS